MQPTGLAYNRTGGLPHINHSQRFHIGIDDENFLRLKRFLQPLFESGQELSRLDSSIRLSLHYRSGC
jgi:hypothetical protein